MLSSESHTGAGWRVRSVSTQAILGDFLLIVKGTSSSQSYVTPRQALPPAPLPETK